MTNLITEARELIDIGNDEGYDVLHMVDCMDSLCDALEKAEKRIRLLEDAIDRQNNTIAYLSSTNGQGFNW